ncbi:wnt family protein [Ancylostoma caninum]|uniref:Protein Wnt n=1 Tax=Ancylostoma caninum TaxID=29170 RepID=A0A368GMF5_ANCCA|nr:wnt family protein [Ancylostoma caninum]
MMDSVRYGAQNAYAECQYQFNKRRWNCTLIDPITLELISDVMMRDGTRESAFVHAVSAAGVAYRCATSEQPLLFTSSSTPGMFRVTRDCARGLNERCGCDQSMLTLDPQVRSYDYQGCSDNVQYGIAISREFVDAAERGKNASSRAILNLHNNRAGRQVSHLSQPSWRKRSVICSEDK